MARKLIFCLAFAALVSATWAWDGTYIDANTTNTFRYDGSTDWWFSGAVFYDKEWEYRTGFGMANGEAFPATATSVVSGGDIFQSIRSSETGKDAYTLKTTITDLDAGQMYYIYTFFWSDEHGSPWTIRAAFTQAGLADAGSVYSPYTGNVIQVGLDSASRIMWAADMGTVTGVTSLEIWVDDLPTDNSNERTWLDGFGYGVNPVPEPLTIALLGLGGLLLRRRKR